MYLRVFGVGLLPGVLRATRGVAVTAVVSVVLGVFVEDVFYLDMDFVF